MIPASRLNFEMSDDRPPSPARGSLALGVICVILGVSLVAPPLSVLYDANDESTRMAPGGAATGTVGTLYRTPPLIIDRMTYAALRTVCVAGAANALLLAAAGGVMTRSRARGFMMLGVNAVAHVVLMGAMVWAAARFSQALGAATAKQPWMNGRAYESSVRRTAVWAALPGVVYPVVLFFLIRRHQRGGRRVRLG